MINVRAQCLPATTRSHHHLPAGLALRRDRLCPAGRARQRADARTCRRARLPPDAHDRRDRPAPTQDRPLRADLDDRPVPFLPHGGGRDRGIPKGSGARWGPATAQVATSRGIRMDAWAAGPAANATCARRRRRTRSATDRWWRGRRKPGRSHRAHPIGRLRRVGFSSARSRPWSHRRADVILLRVRARRTVAVNGGGGQHRPGAAGPGGGPGCGVLPSGGRRAHDLLLVSARPGAVASGCHSQYRGDRAGRDGSSGPASRDFRRNFRPPRPCHRQSEARGRRRQGARRTRR